MIDHKQQLLQVPLMGISRHRLGLDGAGVTTLVTFYGCRLRCKYCINPECFQPNPGAKVYTPQSLLEELMKDDIYFRATEGGVTFGGGEPGLHADFIVAFKQICPPEWKIRLETSLQFDTRGLKLLAPVVDEWFVDVKTDNYEIYRRYTGGDYQRVIDHLSVLVDKLGVRRSNIVLRIPVIPGYVDMKRALLTKKDFLWAGFHRLDVFKYREVRPEHAPSDGKERCELLKRVRQELAEANGLAYVPRPCSHEGDCPGTCPLCEQELKKLSADLKGAPEEMVKVSEETCEMINTLYRPDNRSLYSKDEEEPWLAGVMAPGNPPTEQEDFDGMMELPKGMREQLERELLDDLIMLQGEPTRDEPMHLAGMPMVNPRWEEEEKEREESGEDDEAPENCQTT
jgi:pyruvate formate lyase activating enzyme